MTPAFRELLGRVPEIRTLYERIPDGMRAALPFDEIATVTINSTPGGTRIDAHNGLAHPHAKFLSFTFDFSVSEFLASPEGRDLMSVFETDGDNMKKIMFVFRYFEEPECNQTHRSIALKYKPAPRMPTNEAEVVGWLANRRKLTRI